MIAYFYWGNSHLQKKNLPEKILITKKNLCKKNHA